MVDNLRRRPMKLMLCFQMGERQVLFRPLEPYETPDAIAMICESYQRTLEKEQVDPLILIPFLFLDFFVYIHLMMEMEE